MKFSIFKTIGDGFSLVKKNPIILLPLLIASLLSYLNELILGSRIDLGTLAFSLVFILATLFLYGMTIRVAYDATSRKKISLGNAARITMEKFFGIILGTILVSLIFLAGSIFLIIPGIFLFVKLFFFEFALLIDKTNVMQSLKKSWKATRGNWWRSFVLLLIMSLPLISLMIVSLLLIPFGQIGSLIYYLLSALVSGWYTATLTLAYLKLRK